MNNPTIEPWQAYADDHGESNGLTAGEMTAADGITSAGTSSRARLIATTPELLALTRRVIETAKICRDCEWDVSKYELVQLLTSLEAEAIEVFNKTKGGA